MDLLSIGRKKPRSLAAKVELFEKLGPLLGGLEGKVELRRPAHIIGLLEDCREPEPAGGWVGRTTAGDPTSAQPPRHLFVGRQLSEGAASHLDTFSLSRRPYLGRTTLPPEYAYLMAVQARVVHGSKVFDPFCGTASTLMSCAALGAETFGMEVDGRVLHGKVGERHGITLNFETVGLAPPTALLLGNMSEFETHMGQSARAWPSTFDAIVTDPPYGLMEGRGPYFVPLGQRFTALLHLACRRLRHGGRLVFLLPIPSGAETDAVMLDRLPTSQCLAVERIIRQPLSLRMHRLLVTLVKVAEPATLVEGLVEGQSEDEELHARAEAGHNELSWEAWWAIMDQLEGELAREESRVW